MEHVQTNNNERTDNELLDVIYEPIYNSPIVDMTYNHNLPVIQLVEDQEVSEIQ